MMNFINIIIPTEVGIQYSCGFMDSRFHGNDKKEYFWDSLFLILFELIIKTC